VKRTDLEKNKGLKINSKLNQTGTPSRYGAESATVDRRAKRKRDQELGLVPFAVKLNSDLVKQIQALTQTRDADINEIVAELLKKGLGI
jgi:hypothetical protein